MNHQGVVLEVALPEELSENDLKVAVEHLSENALFLVLDNVQDPHNLGACLRTADATGVHGIIITKDNAVGITPTVCKVASGSASFVSSPRVSADKIAEELHSPQHRLTFTSGHKLPISGTAKINVHLILCARNSYNNNLYV